MNQVSRVQNSVPHIIVEAAVALFILLQLTTTSVDLFKVGK